VYMHKLSYLFMCEYLRVCVCECVCVCVFACRLIRLLLMSLNACVHLSDVRKTLQSHSHEHAAALCEIGESEMSRSCTRLTCGESIDNAQRLMTHEHISVRRMIGWCRSDDVKKVHERQMTMRLHPHSRQG
jgi:hypothetical protein